MRTIYFVFITLCVAGWLAANVDVDPPSDPSRSGGGWRRAVDGWEDSFRWHPDDSADNPAVHPAVVASFQLLFSVWALLVAPILRIDVPLSRDDTN